MADIIEFFHFWTYALDLFYGVLGNIGQFFSFLPASVGVLMVTAINIAIVWRFLGWGD